MPFVVGETLGPYRITEQLGQGGMATVFKAYHAALDRYVAIKALHPAFKEDVNFLARFQREARVVASLDHPNIVPIYDFAEHEGRPYLVMKFIPGETLKARLNQRPLTLAEINTVVEAVGNALAYAHGKGILHRDVKPSNVLLSVDGPIYLADFGLARIASAGESTMSSDMMLGTPQYISPEQALGKRDLDEGTDIYSFGVLLYEMMVGKVPFSADTPYAIIHDHIYSPLPLPHTLNPKINDAMERVLLKALAKERTDRYQTVLELVEVFQTACGGYDASAPMAGFAAKTPLVSPAALAETQLPPQPVTGTETHLPAEAGAAPVAEPPAQETLPPPPTLKSTAGQKPVYKRWYFWLILGAAIVGFCACAWFGVGWLRHRKAPRQVNPIPMLVTQSANLPADPLQAARQRANANPNDAMAHLDLAVVLVDAHLYADVPPELSKVENLMKDYPFYTDNGRKFRAGQKWIVAAWAFTRVMELNPDAKTGEPLEFWREAVYKAFNDPAAGTIIDLNRIRAVDPPMAGVADAQAKLAAGNILPAEKTILEVIRQSDKFPEALLVQARILARQNAGDRALQILDALRKNADLPGWIRDEIARIVDVELPKP